MSLTLWNSRFSVTLVRQHSTIFTSAASIKTTTAANNIHYTSNFNSIQQRRNLTIMKPTSQSGAERSNNRSIQSGSRNNRNIIQQQGRSSVESSNSDTGLNVPPFNHPHCDRQAMYQQPERKVKPLRGKPAQSVCCCKSITFRTLVGNAINYNGGFCSFLK